MRNQAASDLNSGIVIGWYHAMVLCLGSIRIGCDVGAWTIKNRHRLRVRLKMLPERIGTRHMRPKACALNQRLKQTHRHGIDQAAHWLFRGTCEQTGQWIGLNEGVNRFGRWGIEMVG